MTPMLCGTTLDDAFGVQHRSLPANSDDNVDAKSAGNSNDSLTNGAAGGSNDFFATSLNDVVANGVNGTPNDDVVYNNCCNGSSNRHLRNAYGSMASVFLSVNQLAVVCVFEGKEHASRASSFGPNA